MLELVMVVAVDIGRGVDSGDSRDGMFGWVVMVVVVMVSVVAVSVVVTAVDGGGDGSGGCSPHLLGFSFYCFFLPVGDRRYSRARANVEREYLRHATTVFYSDQNKH